MRRPFYRFGASIPQAVIETGTHYVDICDDWEPTLAMLSWTPPYACGGRGRPEWHGRQPGRLFNLLAMLAVEGLDEVENLHLLGRRSGRRGSQPSVLAATTTGSTNWRATFASPTAAFDGHPAAGGRDVGLSWRRDRHGLQSSPAILSRSP